MHENKEDKPMLAYYHYPFVANQEIKEYSREDLMKSTKVEELFDYCQILEAYITNAGWEFLIQFYGYQRLYEIDKKSGWLTERGENPDDIEEYIKWVEYEMDISAE